MDSTAPGPLKPRLSALLAQGLAEQQVFIAQLSDAERAAIGAPDAWAAKDHIAHNAAWKADAAREIAATLCGEDYAVESTTVFNPRVFVEQQHQSWDVILADTEQADAALRLALEACSEVDLRDPARFPWREGLPLWTTALVSGYEHPAEHYAQFYLESGDVEHASAARRQVVDTARRLIGETEEFGYIVYNLGCFYAQTGQPGLAIAAIREAFAGAPSLREGSREDPQLASLHDDPAFQALVSETVDAAEASTSTD
jgi:tetratricopeptide (TPR) repeat protein